MGRLSSEISDQVIVERRNSRAPAGAARLPPE